MRWLILSDVHSNLEALQTVVKAAEGQYDRVVCLGDLVGYGPDPNSVVEWARARASYCIRGNHDKAMWDPEVVAGFNYAARIAAEWTREQLTEDNLQYLRELPRGPLETGGFTIAHGALSDEDKYIVCEADVLEELRYFDTGLVFYGHTHSQTGHMTDECGRLLSLSPQLPRGRSRLALQLLPGERYLINPGAVGQPRNRDTRAAFCVYDDMRQDVEFWRAPYDVAATQSRMEACGLPSALVQRLSFGR